MRDRNYLDGEIKKGRFASYGHCLRYLVHSDKVQKRELSKLRSENARMKGVMEVLQSDDITGYKSVHRTLSESIPKRD
ncbi:hypothetical protein LCGC14_2520460 [marine sediment metagenome]|uniref:Uncharacterized protein n=1 Tax=marine sediment metagenome TaxID=412755 RepID=A0A0F9BJI6_9ZZZZ